MEEHVSALVGKYNEGLADPAEVRQLEKWIEEGVVSLTDLTRLDLLEDQIMGVRDRQPSMDLDQRFHEMLAREKRGSKASFSFQWPSFQLMLPRLAFATVLLIAGFTAGYLLNKQSEHTNVQELKAQITDLKEMMMLSLLEKESATDRLKAVNLTSEMNQASQQVTQALIQTLNNDMDVNVRLAALDALRPYTSDAKVRQELVRSISHQDSPLVQVALSELMVALQERKSVDELKKILEDERTPADVRDRIKENIEVLI
ncbi:MAG: HEAT repeat domain-containing protein [Cyclobacteriaceae bacterium]